jgi:uncharacterized protein (TIGR03066 family)
MKKIIPILMLLAMSMLLRAGDPPPNDKSTHYLIGKWEIRTYGYHFKADGTMDLFNPDDGSKLSSGTWSIKGNQLRIKTENQEQNIKIKIISKDEWEWIVAPDRTWEALRIK